MLVSVPSVALGKFDTLAAVLGDFFRRNMKILPIRAPRDLGMRILVSFFSLCILDVLFVFVLMRKSAPGVVLTGLAFLFVCSPSPFHGL